MIVNEAAKMRYRSGGEWEVGGLVIRAPCSAVGHGGLYHSQMIESFFSQVSGLRVVIPRGCVQAKGLLTAAIQSPDPVIFLEPKSLYRAMEEDVPASPFKLELDKADVMTEGDSMTVISYGPQIYVVQKAVDILKEKRPQMSIEIVDLQTVYPFDEETVFASVRKTGRVLVTHEAPLTGGLGAEVTAKIQEKCFLHLEAPIGRVCGWDTPFPLKMELLYLPNVARVLQALEETLDF